MVSSATPLWLLSPWKVFILLRIIYLDLEINPKLWTSTS